MSVYREEIIDIDIETGTTHRTFMNHSIGEGDANGNVFGFRCRKNRVPVNLTGYTITGYFIRPDKETVIIGGTATGNTGYVVLPATCYAVEGNFTLVIKITGGGITSTMIVIDGTVINTTTDAVIDPGGIVPDLEELMAVIERAEAAAETIGDFAITEELISGSDYRLVVNVTNGE